MPYGTVVWTFTDGNWWSNKANSIDGAGRLIANYAQDVEVSTNGNAMRYRGNPLRCLHRP